MKSFKNFIIINGYKELNSKDSDIDILLRKSDFKRVEKLLKENFKNEKLVQIYHHDLYAKNCFLWNKEKKELLNLDIYGRLERRKVVFFNEDEIFETLRFYKKIPILSSEKEFIYYLIKKLDKNDFNEKVFNYLKELYFESEEKSIKVIKKFLKNEAVNIIKAFEKNNINLINREKILKEFDKNKKTNFFEKILNFFRIIKRIIRPTGISIAFLGPDGSGKSTIINELKKRQLPFRRIDYFHLKPLKRRNNDLQIVEEPHKYPPYSKIKSFVKLVYFVYQYNIGWIKNILPLKIRSSLIIFDRYYDDILADKKRYRISLGDFWIKFFRNFIPKPDLYFILVTEPEIVYNRKQEVSFEELKNQVKKYERLVDNKKYIKIDVNKKPEEIVNEIINILMEKMSERYK
ncbi:hypothetical protein [Caminibacter pacificus]|uniref:Thymidylate kinase n=1 Tax=Caminibacter pacificus TaxID=1424653 RepID=A0AAJ4UXH0_9BACT|nr:hypothetical protein [Caminibacter pacificus]QDD68117.1 hypothetical protein C6V80_09715 [Caminibacter pacificus]ROR39149.1 thymidylate kinase [Caminibacter pacificus]